MIVEQENICIEQDCGRVRYSTFWCEEHFLEWKNDKRPLDRLTSGPEYGMVSDVGLDAAQKQCEACCRWYDEADFGHPDFDDDRYCRDCQIGRRRWEKYGLRPSDVDKMLAQQDGKCDICAQAIGIATCHVDHDHSCCPAAYTCGKCVRGLLCNRCNVLLGYARDSINILLAAKDYLEKHA